MNTHIDRLYDLLPEVYRRHDAKQGFPLKALLRVVAGQADILEEDIAQLYENWFIETCQDWVVPYIGDLVGYQTVYAAGETQTGTTSQQEQRERFLIPRRDVARTIRQRRRKGTLSLLEELAHDVAGWSARAVEFLTLLVQTQNIKYLNLGSDINTTPSLRGQTLSLRKRDALERLNGVFDETAHTVDVRSVISHRTSGWYNLPSVGLFVWRLKNYSVTQTPANNVQEAGKQFFTFSILGNNCHLSTNPSAQLSATAFEELRFPTPIRQRAFSGHIADYYGAGKSVQLWVSTTLPSVNAPQTAISRQPDPSLAPVPPKRIITADLSRWQQPQLAPDQIALDPAYGRVAFPENQIPTDVWVSYYYAFSADIGGGEYNRVLSEPSDATLYRVGGLEEMKSITAALEQWGKANPKPLHAVIEITDSGIYTEPLNISLAENERLQIRASNNKRPVIRTVNWQADSSQNITITGKVGSRITLDGLLIAGRGVSIQGDFTAVVFRHCTLVPGWGIKDDGQPRWTDAANPLYSLNLLQTSARVTIEHSIIGSIQVDPRVPVTTNAPTASSQNTFPDPISMSISDSILDATSADLPALSMPGAAIAPVQLKLLRSTVLGMLRVHAIELAENSIITGQITVARRQIGCMRFCSITLPSRTPSRYNCQPDLVIQAVNENDALSAQEKNVAKVRESTRVQPLFTSTHYGMPAYCQLAQLCAEEIKSGADDESEMGVFHDLYQPQRTANLRARLDEYTPGGMDTGIIYVN